MLHGTFSSLKKNKAHFYLSGSILFYIFQCVSGWDIQDVLSSR